MDKSVFSPTNRITVGSSCLAPALRREGTAVFLMRPRSGININSYGCFHLGTFQIYNYVNRVIGKPAEGKINNYFSSLNVSALRENSIKKLFHFWFTIE